MKIETKFLFQGKDTVGREKIISASLFRMKSSYRTFEKYLKNAIRFIDQCKRILPTWTLRIYIDESIQQDEIEMLHADHVEIVLYKCEDFFDEESGTHEGVFGTFMRFLPMFSAQKYIAMASSDIDIGDFMIEYFSYFDKHAEEIGLVNSLCYSHWIPRDIKFNLLAGGIYSKVVFPRYILMNFLKDVKAGKVSISISKKTDKETYIPYGTDEYFLNTKLYSYIEKHKIKVLAATLSTILTGIRKILWGIQDPERLRKIERIMIPLSEIERQFWRDPRKLPPNVFKNYLKQVIDLMQPEFENSLNKQCILDYLKNPRIVKIQKYNY